MKRTELLVIGGGPVGLSAALLAARYGVACTLVEQFPAPYNHPKARGVRNRAMELFRSWGLEQEIRAMAPPDPAYGFIYCNSLSGEEYGRTPAGPEETALSPTGSCRVPQDDLERLLRARVSATPGIDARFGLRLEQLAQAPSQVTATVVDQDSGRADTIVADYVIAADGAASATRAALGVQMTGEMLGYWQSAYWHGDISHLVQERSAIQFLTADPSGGFVTVAPVDGKKRWLTFRMPGPDSNHPGILSEEQAKALIHTAVGVACEADVVSAATYTVEAKVANRYRVGRVFLAGDAAHVFPPTGGFGLTTGVQDVHNLVWKLSLVRAGAAGDAFLNSYETERRPIAVSNAQWSTTNAARFRKVWDRMAAGKPAGDIMARQRAHVAALERELAFRYTQGALDAGSGEPCADPFVAAVGRRAPHLWLSDAQGRRTSTLDLFDGRLTVLHGPDGQGWAKAAHAAGSAYGVSLHTVCLPEGDLHCDAADFDRLYGLAEADAMLIRPDGHVSFIGSASEGRDVEEQMLEAVRLTLCAARE